MWFKLKFSADTQSQASTQCQRDLHGCRCCPRKFSNMHELDEFGCRRLGAHCATYARLRNIVIGWFFCFTLLAFGWNHSRQGMGVHGCCACVCGDKTATPVCQRSSHRSDRGRRSKWHLIYWIERIMVIWISIQFLRGPHTLLAKTTNETN